MAAAGLATQLGGGIFACPADGYGAGRYLGYCDHKYYGNFDERNYYWGFDGISTDALASAEILILGNSRTQFAFSNDDVRGFFGSRGWKVHILGLSGRNYAIAEVFLARQHPRPRAVIVNADPFYASAERPIPVFGPWERLRGWGQWMAQAVHHQVCGRWSGLCGRSRAVFMASADGTWILNEEWGRDSIPAKHFGSDSGGWDDSRVGLLATGMAEMLRIDPGCVIHIYVPSSEGRPSAGRALAAAGFPYIEWPMEGLMTSDGTHLDQASARRWSADILAGLEPVLRRCLKDGGG